MYQSCWENWKKYSDSLGTLNFDVVPLIIPLDDDNDNELDEKSSIFSSDSESDLSDEV